MIVHDVRASVIVTLEIPLKIRWADDVRATQVANQALSEARAVLAARLGEARVVSMKVTAVMATVEEA